jgi:hypothetical protein
MIKSSLLFDAYLVVDWSANSTPKQGKDSIWWCHLAWDGDTLEVIDIQNPATRRQAYMQLYAVLDSYADTDRRLLAGFDFAYGYPAGFARAISSGTGDLWRVVWEHMYSVIDDDDKNRNNRYAVAAGLNRALSNSTAPFWGCPSSQETAYLSMRKPRGEQADLFPEYRLAEQIGTAHPVWKCCYPGAVGGQVLMGLPYLYELISDDRLGPVSRVWPFETGLGELTAGHLDGVNIVHAEIYPSIVSVDPGPDEIKDRVQVVSLASTFAGLDQQGRLGALFAGRSSLTPSEKMQVEREEGWILGVV